MGTHIEWTDETWNPTVGCSEVSPGCDNCYAVRVAARLLTPAHWGLVKPAGFRTPPKWNGTVRLMPERLDAPLQWRKPRRVFVDSMSDLFHPEVDHEFISEVWARMYQAHRHTFQVLTKRPQRMAAVLSEPSFVEHVQLVCEQMHDDPDDMYVQAEPWPPKNVWLGTSIESDRYAFRADHVRTTPAAVRFLSVEPLIAPVPSLDFSGIDWVIVGGESGPGARPMELEWAEDVADRASHHAGAAVFVKQLGSVWARENGATDRKGGDWAEWPEHLRIREYPR